jgi:uncharacterized protein YyaL (SSP411 family)
MTAPDYRGRSSAATEKTPWTLEHKRKCCLLRRDRLALRLVQEGLGDFHRGALPDDDIDAIQSAGPVFEIDASHVALLVSFDAFMNVVAQAALVLGEERYAKRAARAAEFILTTMRSKEGRLPRSSMDGQTSRNGFLDDYAFLIAGLLDLYEATSALHWLEEALALDGVLEDVYEDKEHGGYFMTSDDHESLLAREKPAYDGAEPSGNSVQALNLLRLHELTTDDRYRRRAERALQAFGDRLEQAPAALSEMLLASDFHFDTPKEVVIVTPASRADAEPLLGKLRSTFLPNRVLAVVAEGRDLAAQSELVPILEGKVARGGRATAYVCERRICDLPTSDPEVFEKQIRNVAPLKAADTPP